MKTLNEYRTTLNKLKGKKEELALQVHDKQIKIKELTREKKRSERSQIVLQIVAQATQKEFEFHISELVSLALAILPDPYKLVIDFVVRRNKVEADIFFSRREEKSDPLTATGGGAVDIASFALRCALWGLATNRTQPVLILDEPFKFVSPTIRPLTGEMVKQLSDKLGLQIIMVTHIPELIECGDKTFNIQMIKGVSNVTINDL